MESKLHESGLAGVQLAELCPREAQLADRKPGTDRHHIDGHAAVLPGGGRDAGRPPGNPDCKTSHTPFDGLAASINLTIQGMYVAELFGQMNGVDPGRPKVAAFGLKLYGMKIGTTGTNLTLT